MLFFGDVSRHESIRAKLDAIAEQLDAVAAMPAGVARHAELVVAFVEAGELVQGLADRDFGREGRDAPSAAQANAMSLLLMLARAVWTSWTSAFTHGVRLAPGSWRSLESGSVDAIIQTKLVEGFAFYAVYPESYASAATISGLDAATAVIGIRSIGAPLGAMVAAALGSQPPVTVRPTGHPFRRVLSVSPDMRQDLLAGPAKDFAVVDEGPGLSGSSFGTVADFLDHNGVAADRIIFFPSHGGDPGPQSSERHLARWRRAKRRSIGFDELVLRAPRPEHRLATWLGDLLGQPDVTLEDVSGGAWRPHRCHREADWPPVNAWSERRKFLVRAGREVWLAKYVGLGADGRRKAGRARALAAAELAPPVAGFTYGFLVERWIGDAVPLDPAGRDPGVLAQQVGRYLGFRARSFPAEPGRGASLGELLAMARHNVAEAFGTTLAGWFDRWTSQDVARLARSATAIETDNRMQAWEWLSLADGRLLKCDAVDHHAAHDLVGCQDVAWDVAGAIIELELGAGPGRQLRAAVEREAGRAIDPELVALLTPCYLAFQLGAWTMASNATTDPAEMQRLRQAVDRYATLLRNGLAQG